jgi:hypothetical protein
MIMHVYTLYCRSEVHTMHLVCVSWCGWGGPYPCDSSVCAIDKGEGGAATGSARSGSGSGSGSDSDEGSESEDAQLGDEGEEGNGGEAEVKGGKEPSAKPRAKAKPKAGSVQLQRAKDSVGPTTHPHP